MGELNTARSASASSPAVSAQRRGVIIADGRGGVITLDLGCREMRQILIEAGRNGQRQDRTFRRPTTSETWRVLVSPLHPQGPARQTSAGVAARGYLVLTIEDLTELHRLKTVRRDLQHFTDP